MGFFIRSHHPISEMSWSRIHRERFHESGPGNSFLKILASRMWNIPVLGTNGFHSFILGPILSHLQNIGHVRCIWPPLPSFLRLFSVVLPAGVMDLSLAWCSAAKSGDPWPLQGIPCWIGMPCWSLNLISAWWLIPRIVNGLVHPSDFSGLTLQKSHVNHWGELTH